MLRYGKCAICGEGQAEDCMPASLHKEEDKHESASNCSNLVHRQSCKCTTDISREGTSNNRQRANNEHITQPVHKRVMRMKESGERTEDGHEGEEIGKAEGGHAGYEQVTTCDCSTSGQMQLQYLQCSGKVQEDKSYPNLSFLETETETQTLTEALPRQRKRKRLSSQNDAPRGLSSTCSAERRAHSSSKKQQKRSNSPSVRVHPLCLRT